MGIQAEPQGSLAMETAMIMLYSNVKVKPRFLSSCDKRISTIHQTLFATCPSPVHSSCPTCNFSPLTALHLFPYLFIMSLRCCKCKRREFNLHHFILKRSCHPSVTSERLFEICGRCISHPTIHDRNYHASVEIHHPPAADDYLKACSRTLRSTSILQLPRATPHVDLCRMQPRSWHTIYPLLAIATRSPVVSHSQQPSIACPRISRGRSSRSYACHRRNSSSSTPLAYIPLTHPSSKVVPREDQTIITPKLLHFTIINHRIS
ncbi:hypothetical protein BDY19DRAFT_387527 [Irpex rosettiformis]|uniref:Uncharacterized protein n=1 Tax=Irpex rosettiformis TaxID=378272 RepID=A0ACB8TVC1_9APHY|nr:hypothetical protein BDY19DRAFT_387527 [Irpex rosettiformis]